jgi:hypothetical protein
MPFIIDHLGSLSVGEIPTTRTEYLCMNCPYPLGLNRMHSAVRVDSGTANALFREAPKDDEEDEDEKKDDEEEDEEEGEGYSE